jgi:NADH-quinone oxidoreductase subunit L/multicomponent Na+:H+ antiporter subunit D
MLAFGVAAAGMAGIPLVAGFVSKWYLLLGSVGAGQPIFAVVLLVSGVLNIAYFWPVFYQAFFEGEDDHDAKPLVEFPLGGESHSILPDEPTYEPDPVTDGGQGDDHDDHHGGPPAGGWERRGWLGGESTWFMLGPILTAMTGAVVLGVIPGTAVFLRLVKVIVAAATGVAV